MCRVPTHVRLDVGAGGSLARDLKAAVRSVDGDPTAVSCRCSWTGLVPPMQGRAVHSRWSEVTAIGHPTAAIRVLAHRHLVESHSPNREIGNRALPPQRSRLRSAKVTTTVISPAASAGR